MTVTFQDLEDLVQARRTNLFVANDRPVDPALVDSLCRLATWAPNHKRTWPTRFAWVTSDARSRLGEAVAAAMADRGDQPAKVAKARTKYLRAPGLLVVAATAGDSELRTAENRDTAAAGVQNALLGATAAGLASFWSSCPTGANDVVVRLCGFEHRSTVVAMVYLGWPNGSSETPPRPPADVQHITI